MDFATVIRRSARDHRDRTAVWFEGREQTYAEMYERACRLANGLRGLGVRTQDRVAVLSDNLCETVEIAAACALGNTPVATLYTYYTPETNAYLVERLDARVLIVDHALLDRVRPREDGGTTHLVVVGGEPPEGAVAYDELLASASREDPQVRAAPDDVHIIRFSSGTTGKPKAMWHTVEKWFAYNSGWRWSTPAIDERDTYVAAGSLAHLAVAYLWGMLMVGGTVVPMPRFDPARFAEIVEDRRATYATMVPTMIAMVLDEPSTADRDLSSLRCLTYAGAPIAPATMRRAIDRFGPCLHQMYAQSEVAPVTMLLPHEHKPDGTETEVRRLRSVGRPGPTVQVRIVDDEGHDVPDGELGEVAANSPGGMSGIWGDPEATAARILDDGSIRTRDMGRLDADGYLFLADRKDDMIISGGYNIWPLELENALHEHPSVAEACVVGVPDPKWGETPRAYVVAADGHEVDEDELIAHTRERCGAVKRVTSVEVVGDLPRSGAGKVQRTVLRDRHWQGATKVGGS